jgi:hypothetical protein
MMVSKMTDDQKTLAAELDRVADDARRLAERVRRHESDSSVIARILAGELLNLDQAADVAECSNEKLRKCGLAPRSGRRNMRVGRGRKSRWWRCRRRRHELFGRDAPESGPIVLTLSFVVRDPERTSASAE